MPKPKQASRIKRHRRTQAEMQACRDAIVEALEVEHPVTLRRLFYRLVSRGDDLVKKEENDYDKLGVNAVPDEGRRQCPVVVGCR